jgi:hypothetical protein
MWVFDRETLQFLDVNRAAVAQYGYTRQEFLSMSVGDVRVPEEAGESQPTVGVGQRVRQWRHRLKDGRVVHVEIAEHDIEYGGRNAALAVLIDFTQRKLLEEQLRQSQKMEAVGMLAGGVAHDFNNLLTIINGYSQLLLTTLSAHDPNRSAVEQILKAGERAAALTRQLLTFSRRQALQPKVLDLNALVASLAVMLRRLIGEDIDLRLVMGPELGRVNADPGQLEQVIMNLAVNARDAMPRGGVLTIETANVELDESYTGRHITIQPGPFVLLAVSDNGVGMDAETRKHLFEPFFTTKGQGRGTGLGLSTVFGIVKQSGGSIDVYSEPGRGTSVKVYLPRIDQPAVLESEHETAAGQGGWETILLVEDDEMVRHLVRETLEREGYRILDAGDGAEARRIVENHSGQIHLLITDIIMPRQGGRELAADLAPLRPEMKVLYMSGYTDQAVIHSGIVDGDTAFLQKPFMPVTLTRKVRELLERGDGGQVRPTTGRPSPG